MDIVGFGALNVDLTYKISHDLAKKLKIKSGKEIKGKTLGSLRNLENILTKEKLLLKSSGGSAANTIAALSLMGFKTGYIGKIGGDPNGQYLLESLITLPKVDTSQIITGSRKSGVAFALYTRNQKDRFLGIFPGENDYIRTSEINLSYLNTTKIIHLTSFVCANSQTSFKTQVEILRRISPNILVSFDGGELYARKGLKALKSILNRTNIFFLTEQENNLLTKKKYENGAKDLLNYGISIVVVKLGDKGCYVLSKNEELNAPASSIKLNQIKDTVGAGDVFDAGFLAGILRKKTLKKCAEFANKVATKSITGIGRAKYPSRQDLKYL